MYPIYSVIFIEYLLSAMYCSGTENKIENTIHKLSFLLILIFQKGSKTSITKLEKYQGTLGEYHGQGGGGDEDATLEWRVGRPLQGGVI